VAGAGAGAAKATKNLAKGGIAYEECYGVQGVCQVGGENQGGALAAEADAEGSAADEGCGHGCGVRKMAEEYSGEEGHENKVHQGGDARDEASGDAMPWGLESIDRKGGAKAPGDEEDRRADAASKPIIYNGPLAAQSEGLAAGASGIEAAVAVRVSQADLEMGFLACSSLGS
jgi:hypothetical protein